MSVHHPPVRSPREPRSSAVRRHARGRTARQRQDEMLIARQEPDPFPIGRKGGLVATLSSIETHRLDLLPVAKKQILEPSRIGGGIHEPIPIRRDREPRRRIDGVALGCMDDVAGHSRRARRVTGRHPPERTGRHHNADNNTGDQSRPSPSAVGGPISRGRVGRPRPRPETGFGLVGVGLEKQPRFSDVTEPSFRVLDQAPTQHGPHGGRRVVCDRGPPCQDS